jgi:hypothetical protein
MAFPLLSLSAFVELASSNWLRRTGFVEPASSN